jgi:hypothetical protein
MKIALRLKCGSMNFYRNVSGRKSLSPAGEGES